MTLSLDSSPHQNLVRREWLSDNNYRVDQAGFGCEPSFMYRAWQRPTIQPTTRCLMVYLTPMCTSLRHDQRTMMYWEQWFGQNIAFCNLSWPVERSFDSTYVKQISMAIGMLQTPTIDNCQVCFSIFPGNHHFWQEVVFHCYCLFPPWYLHLTLPRKAERFQEGEIEIVVTNFFCSNTFTTFYGHFNIDEIEIRDGRFHFSVCVSRSWRSNFLSAFYCWFLLESRKRYVIVSGAETPIIRE